MNGRFKKWAAIAAAAGMSLGLGAIAQADEDATIAAGKARFMENCASCHGEDAKGYGERASKLADVPSNLTILSKSNGGKFPFKLVYDTIDGRQHIGAHGSRDMPVWGAEYRLGVPTAGGMAESVVRGKILELIVYLESIQEE